MASTFRIRLTVYGRAARVDGFAAFSRRPAAVSVPPETAFIGAMGPMMTGSAAPSVAELETRLDGILASAAGFDLQDVVPFLSEETRRILASPAVLTGTAKLLGSTPFPEDEHVFLSSSDAPSFMSLDPVPSNVAELGTAVVQAWCLDNWGAEADCIARTVPVRIMHSSGNATWWTEFDAGRPMAVQAVVTASSSFPELVFLAVGETGDGGTAVFAFSSGDDMLSRKIGRHSRPGDPIARISEDMLRMLVGPV
jgi:hypothetical protein